MKNFTVERPVQKKESVTVGFDDVKPMDIRAMKIAQLRQYTLQMYRLMHSATVTQEPTHQWIPPTEIIVEDKVIPIKHQPSSSKNAEIRFPKISESGIGRKLGKTSKYHYVHWNTQSQAFKCAVEINGKKSLVGSFAYEDEKFGALKIDAFLDGIEDPKRPRNRDEFPEIMELYIMATAHEDTREPTATKAKS